MLDFGQITGFDWDDGNVRKIDKHAVSQMEAEQVFLDPRLLILTDEKHSAEENSLSRLRPYSCGPPVAGEFYDARERDFGSSDFDSHHEPKGKGTL